MKAENVQMSETESVAHRFDRLETRVAHHERTIADLNEIITTQWRQIDALQRQVQRLREELQNAQRPHDGPEPPPPHY